MAEIDIEQPAQIGPLHAFDVVVVPFPFNDRHATKRRPALVLSGAAFNTATGHSVLAMVTSAAQSAWPADVALTDLKSANLPQACVARLKLFTLDHRLILRKAGQLSPVDAAAVQAAWAGQLLMANRRPAQLRSKRLQAAGQWGHNKDFKDFDLATLRREERQF